MAQTPVLNSNAFTVTIDPNNTQAAAQFAGAAQTSASASSTSASNSATSATASANSATQSAASATAAQNSVAQVVASRAEYLFTATAGQTSWSQTNLTWTPGTAEVYVNGLSWDRTVSFTDSSGSSIGFVNPLAAGAQIKIRLGSPISLPITGVSSSALSLATPGNGTDMVGFKGANGFSTTVSALALSGTNNGDNLIAHSATQTVAQAIDPAGVAGTLTGTETETIKQSGSFVSVTLNAIATWILSTFTILVGFGTGEVARTVLAWIKERPISVKSFGAVGDGVTDDTQSINKAISAASVNGSVYFPGGGNNYLHKATLTQLQGQKWFSDAGQRAASLVKGFNGDAVVMGTLGQIADMNFIGNGATYSGKGITVTNGFSQKITNVRSTLSQDNALYFAPGAGGGTTVIGFEGDTINQTTVGAIKIDGANSGPVPIFMSGIWLSGGVLDLSAPGAGNGASISNFYIRNIRTSGPISTGSALFHMANGRVASITDTTTFSGSDFTITGVAFSGPVALVNAQGFLFSSCTYGTGITEDTATCSSNKFETSSVPFTPVWSQASGTQPSLGNGTLAGFYGRSGSLCTVSLRFVVGSTTTFGNNATQYQFSLPFNGNSQVNQRAIFANLYSSAGVVDYSLKGTVGASLNFIGFGLNGSGFRLGYPYNLATNDTLDVQFSYIVQ